MLRYIVIRLLQGLVVIFLVNVVTFGLLQLAPGSPIDILLGEGNRTQAQVEAIERRWGLDQPVHVQYWRWLTNVITGDFGTSIIRSGTPVTQMIGEAIPYTLRLTSLAVILSVLVAVPLGVLAALRRNSVLDYFSTVGSTLGVAIPNYWLGLMGIILFASYLGWLPTFGARDGWRSYVLPVSILAFEEMAVLTRLTRGATLEVLAQDHVVTARAKGLADRVVTFRHVLRNALLPVVTIIGYRLAFILSGTIVIETVFAWPGLGRLFFDSIYRLDYQVVQAIVLLLAAVVIIGNLITDLTYAIIDPRIRLR